MGLTWLDASRPDQRDLAGAVAVLEAARAVDSPWLPGRTVTAYLGRLRHGWDGETPLTALAHDDRGRVAGVVEVWLPRWDNTHLGGVGVTVDPWHRRRGLGRALFEEGVARVRADGRRLVLADCFDPSDGVGFLAAMGLQRARDEVLRRLDVRAVDWPRLDQELAEAERRAAGYELIRLPGSTPEEMIGDVARMTAAINDAPTGTLDIRDEVYNPERIRAYEQAQRASGHRLYRLVARERDTGTLAGHTVLAVDEDRPWHGWQHDTSVVAAHRGHRLGLLLKIGMLRWLADEEPQLRTVDTGNADSNAHMIQVNEVLGFQVLATAVEWQRSLDGEG